MAVPCPMYHPMYGWYIYSVGPNGLQMQFIKSPTQYFAHLGINPPPSNAENLDDLESGLYEDEMAYEEEMAFPDNYSLSPLLASVVHPPHPVTGVMYDSMSHASPVLSIPPIISIASLPSTSGNLPGLSTFYPPTLSSNFVSQHSTSMTHSNSIAMYPKGYSPQPSTSTSYPQAIAVYSGGTNFPPQASTSSMSCPHAVAICPSYSQIAPTYTTHTHSTTNPKSSVHNHPYTMSLYDYLLDEDETMYDDSLYDDASTLKTNSHPSAYYKKCKHTGPVINLQFI